MSGVTAILSRIASKPLQNGRTHLILKLTAYLDTHLRRCLTFTAHAKILRTPPDIRKKRFYFCVPPDHEHRFSAQQKQRKSMFIRSQGERASGRRVAEPRKTRQKRTESHRKRTKFTRKRTVFLQKRTVFRGNGQAFTKHLQRPPGGQDPMIFDLGVFFARPPRRSVQCYRVDRVLGLWHHTTIARLHNWEGYLFCLSRAD